MNDVTTTATFCIINLRNATKARGGARGASVPAPQPGPAVALSASWAAGCAVAFTQPAIAISECSANACVFMAFLLLRLLVAGVIAVAAEDVHNITWSAPPRASLACDAHSLLRGPPPPLLADEGGDTKHVPGNSTKAPALWRRGNDNFELNNKRVDTNGILEVRRQNGSEGVYQCAIRHQGGLLLGYPVHLKFANMDKKIYITINNGSETDHRQPVLLSCHVRSRPPALMHWWKDDQPIENNERYTILGNDLIINDATDAEGTYRCIAENIVLHKNRTASIWLNAGDYECPSESEVSALTNQEQILVAPGGKATLVCPVVGCLRPQVTWHKETRGVASKLASSQLYGIWNMDEAKAGVYWCTVSYNYGKPIKQKMFNVTISEPVAIVLPPVSKEVIRALTVRFNCTATGYPRPEVTWFKDGKPLLLGERYNIRKTGYRQELVVGAVTSDDAGIYQCFADNGLTRATAWAILRVTGESAAIPRAVGCWPNGPNSVLFKWRLPDKYTVIAYTVQTSIAGDYFPGDKGSNNGLNNGEPTNNTSKYITVPKALYPYIFQVRAYLKFKNSGGASDFSKGVVCQGQGVPVQFEVSNDSVTVSWEEFASQNPGIVQWILQTRRDSSEQNYTLNGSVTNYTVPGSSSGLQVRVLGSRFEQWLPQNWTLVPWSTVVVTGKEVVVPEDLKVTKLGSYELALSWRCDAPACRQGYSVCYRSDDRDKCLSTNSESVTLSNLTPDTDYEIRVRVNSMGGQVESFSLPVQVTTQPLEPREPYTLVQYEYAPDSIKIFWNGTGPRLVRYSQNITQPVEQWTSYSVTDNFIELTKLHPSLMTYVMVMSPGHGEKNQPVLTVPPRGASKGTTSYYLTDKQGNCSSYGTNVVLDVPPHNTTSGITSSKSYHYLSIGLPVGMCVLCLLVLSAVCVWRRKKAARSPNRSRRRNVSTNEGDEEEASEMKRVDGGLVNGGDSKEGETGEPLLNGHVHITENPQSKTPNGKMRKGRLYLDTLDLTRHADQDATLETVLDDSSTTTYNLLDTSRRPELDLSRASISANNSFNKLPDDNMNSELTRSTDFEIDNSKIQPMLQPNG
ncbi:protogenin A-like [Plodia interpunctella]|uniref:protogenin A-like n=1 Tax=Plodia interpunctella TaxID=58824 RepID=UPI002368B74E|nr:protogenin A-like [Plodia interpunctella]